jgi:signal transduction histidine kinase
MFHTIIRNLLTNSLKFTRKGGTITLQSHSSSGRVAVSVRDTGVGMNNEIKRKLFDDSSYLSTEGTDAEKGAGLGLMLCKELVEKNDGALYVESEPEKGSTVTVCFPEGRHMN